MNLQDLRNSLLGVHDCIYMNTGWAGPSPTAVLRQIQETLKEESRLGPGSMKWIDRAQEIAESARAAVASLLHVDKESILLTHSTREAVNIILHGLDWQPGDELLICDIEHIAITIPAEALAERYGVQVVRPTIPCQAEQSEVLEIVRRALTPKTRIVALSHIQFSCGLRMPIQDIAQVTHERGIPLLVDGAQSMGHIPIDLTSMECDFYTISGQKWLLGPVGTGALYINPKHHGELRPILTTHAVEDARIDSGSPLARFSLAGHNPALVAGLTVAVHLAMEIGIEQIEQRIMILAGMFREHLRSIPCSLLSPLSADSASGLVTVSLRDWPSLELAKALQARFGIIGREVDYPNGVRFSISHFNTESEVEAVTEALKQLAQESYSAPLTA
jgi:L-cysteine/cystine lyase